jgi:hypothetical protein
MINLTITLVAMEMEQQQTNCQEEGKQNCSNVLNLTSTHFFCLAKAPLIIKMARMAIKQMEDEKKDIINQWNLKSQLLFISSTTTLFSNRDDRKGKRTQKKYSNFVKAILVFKLTAAFSTIEQN